MLEALQRQTHSSQRCSGKPVTRVLDLHLGRNKKTASRVSPTAAMPAATSETAKPQKNRQHWQDHPTTLLPVVRGRGVREVGGGGDAKDTLQQMRREASTIAKNRVVVVDVEVVVTLVEVVVAVVVIVVVVLVIVVVVVVVGVIVVAVGGLHENVRISSTVYRCPVYYHNDVPVHQCMHRCTGVPLYQCTRISV